jgi:hypothetical protein
VQQDDGGCVGRPGFAVEKLVAIDVSIAVMHSGHDVLLVWKMELLGSITHYSHCERHGNP